MMKSSRNAYYFLVRSIKTNRTMLRKGNILNDILQFMTETKKMKMHEKNNLSSGVVTVPLKTLLIT